MLHFSWTRLDSASLSCCIHVLFFREQLHLEKSTFKSFIMLFSCCPHSVPHLPLMPLLSPVTYSASVSAEEITQMEEGTCQLTCWHYHIYHSLFVATVRMGCVSSNVRIHAPQGHWWSSAKWTGVLLLACCQTSCLLPLTRPSDGMLMIAAKKHCHWNTLWNVISDEANPF